MASFGSGLAQGLFAGSRVGQQWRQGYENQQSEELKGKLFQLANEEQAIKAGDQEVGSIMEMVGQSSMGDIQKTLADAYVASGGKIDSKVYNAINLFSQGLYDVKEKAVGYGERRKMFDMNVQKTKAYLANVNSQMAHRGDKTTSMMSNYNWLVKNKGKEYADKWLNANQGGSGKDTRTTFQKEYEFLKQNDPEAAEAYKTKKTTNAPKDRVLKPRDYKDAESAAQSDPYFAELSEEDQNAYIDTFAKTGERPQVEVGTEPGRIFGTNKTYKLKRNATPKAKEETQDTPKNTPNKWGKYNY